MQIILGLPINKSLLIRKRKNTARNLYLYLRNKGTKSILPLKRNIWLISANAFFPHQNSDQRGKQNNPITTGARVGPARQTRGVRRNNGGYYYRHSFPRSISRGKEALASPYHPAQPLRREESDQRPDPADEAHRTASSRGRKNPSPRYRPPWEPIPFLSPSRTRRRSAPAGTQLVSVTCPVFLSCLSRRRSRTPFAPRPLHKSSNYSSGWCVRRPERDAASAGLLGACLPRLPRLPAAPSLPRTKRDQAEKEKPEPEREGGEKIRKPRGG